MLEERLKKLQNYIAKMPSLSTTVTKVLEICNNPASSPSDLNRVISLDPVLTGQMLKLINSAYYGLPSRVTSLTKAIIMLGLNTVKNLVLATSVLSSFRRSKSIKVFSIDDYWAHCLYVGTTAKAIAGLAGVPKTDREEYFVAGLLHDLGKLPMIAAFGDLYCQAVKQSEDEILPLFRTERTQLGFDHCQVGLLIVAKWKLSDDMRHAIVNHHNPMAEGCRPDKLLYAMSLANQMAPNFQIGYAGDRHPDETMIHQLAEHLTTTADDILALKDDIGMEIERARVFLRGTDRG
jgi:putative nucleotidyltransferase with HDIG domain